MDNRHYEKFADGRVKDIEDELPFAVPEGWAWCRLGDVCSIIMGQSPGSSFISNNSDGMEFHQGKIHFTEKYIQKANNYTFSITKIAPKNAILLCVRAPVGVVNITEREICIGRGLCSIYPKYQIQSEFWFYWLQWQKDTFEQKATGTTFQAISIELIKNILIPLPPLSEQHPIVIAIEAIFAQIALLEQNKVGLQTVVKQAKSKILDLAIHGKLVPQDPADEPASVMLERLRAEKEAKIAAGEIKRGKHDSYIYRNPTDNCYYEKFIDGTEEQIEIPFNLPESWCWQKISSICEINPKNKLDNTLEISFVPMTLIDSEFNNNFTYKLQRWETVKSGFSHFSDNDIGIAKITPCFENRKSMIFKNLKNKYGAGTTELHILRTNNKYIFNEYVFWFIKTDAFIKEGINNFTGAVGQQRIGKEFIAETLIPIPPLNEQVKICRTINKLMKKLDKISLNIV